MFEVATLPVEMFFPEFPKDLPEEIKNVTKLFAEDLKLIVIEPKLTNILLNFRKKILINISEM